MTKRAIKILLALAVAVTMFVVVTVVASASEYTYVDRVDAADYSYIGDVVYMLPGDYSYADLYYESLVSIVPSHINVVYPGGNHDSTEDFSAYPDSADTFTFNLGDEHAIVYFEGNTYDGPIFTLSIVSVLPGASGSGDSSGSEDDDTSSDTSKRANRYELLDGTEIVYDPELAYRCRLGFTNHFLPVFYLKNYTEYTDDIFYELVNYADMDISNYHPMSDFAVSGDTVFALYHIENGAQSDFSEGEVYEGLTFHEEGTYVLSLCFRCDCADHMGDDFYIQFWFCVIVMDDLPYIVDSEGGYTGSVNGGFASGFEEGYIKGYDEARDIGFADGLYQGEQKGYGNGYNSGYTDGEKVGYDNGYSDALFVLEGDLSSEYQQGFQDGLESVIDTDGDAISGFFVGISGSAINVLDYVTRNVRIGNNTLFDIVEFCVFVLFCFLVCKMIIKVFSK